MPNVFAHIVSKHCSGLVYCLVVCVCVHNTLCSVQCLLSMWKDKWQSERKTTNRRATAFSYIILFCAIILRHPPTCSLHRSQPFWIWWYKFLSGCQHHFPIITHRTLSAFAHAKIEINTVDIQCSDDSNLNFMFFRESSVRFTVVSRACEKYIHLECECDWLAHVHSSQQHRRDYLLLYILHLVYFIWICDAYSP